MEALPACLLKDVYQQALGSAVIGIDEGQFVSAQQGMPWGAWRGPASPENLVRRRSESSAGGDGKKYPGQFDAAGPCWCSQALPLVPAGWGQWDWTLFHRSDFPSALCGCLDLCCWVLSEMLPLRPLTLFLCLP